MYCKESVLWILELVCLVNFVSAQGPDGSAKVLVLGAGTAGVSAVKALHDQGEEDYLLIEGTTRIGGRAVDLPFGGSRVELGPMWIHSTEGNPIYDMAVQYGLELHLTDYDDYVVYNKQGDNITEEFDEGWETLEPALDFIEELAYDLQCVDTDKPDVSLRIALGEGGWNPRTPAEWTLDSFTADYDSAHFADGISAKYWGYGWTYYDFGEDDYTVVDQRGFRYLMESILGEAMDVDTDPRVIYNARIVSVEQSETHVTVTTSTGETYVGEYAIMTFPLGVLQSGDIQWEPAIPTLKQEAINRYKMVNYIQVYLKFDDGVEPFWDENEYIFFATERHREFSTWMNMDYLVPGSRILQVTLTGEEADKVELMSLEDVQDRAMDVLRDMYGNNIPDPVSVLRPTWRNNQYAYGSYADWPTGYDDSQHANLSSRFERVYFAGETYSKRYYGYMQGAYFTGVHAAQTVLNCIEGGDCDMEVIDNCAIKTNTNRGRRPGHRRRHPRT